VGDERTCSKAWLPTVDSLTGGTTKPGTSAVDKQLRL